MSEVLIKGGRVIDPASGFDETADVLVAEGRVQAIESRPGVIPSSGSLKVIEAEGCIVSPGLIDIHVHFREPDPIHRETIASGSASAINGGFTSVCCMPNTRPPLDHAAMIEFVRHKADLAKGARVFPVGCATRQRQGETVADIGTMARAGAVAFTDDGDPVADAGVLSRVLKTIKESGRCFMQHCQEPTLTRGAVMNAGPLATRLGLTGWPAIAEEIMIERDIRLNRGIGCTYHAQHLSSGDSASIIRRARAENLPVTGEVTPHHLLLTEAACEGYNTQAKMNPPLRNQRDIDMLKEAVADGTITVLGTDHAPHPAESKDTDFASASFGIVGLDCALALYKKALIEDGVLDWPRMLAMMTINPARIVGLDALGLGSLTTGGIADITVIDPDLPWTIDVKEFATTGRNCPFDGLAVTGRAIATIVGGEIRGIRSQQRTAV